MSTPEVPKSNNSESDISNDDQVAIEQHARSTQASSENQEGTFKDTRNDFEKALGSVYAKLSDEEKEKLKQKYENDDRIKSTIDALRVADLGSALGEVDKDENAQRYFDLVMSMVNGVADRPYKPPAGYEDQTAQADQTDDKAPTTDQTGRVGIQAQAFGASTSLVEKWKARRQKKYAQYAEKMRAKGVMDESEIERKFKRRTYITRGALGAAAIVGVVGAGVAAWYLFGRHGANVPTGSGSGSNGHEGAGDWQMPKAGNGQDIVSENQLDRYFSMPDTADMADKLHHANDLSPGNPALEMGDKSGAIRNIHEMLRGNSNITAMWASQLDIPGAPDMPSLDALRSSDGAVIDFNTKINEWGDFLQSHPRVRADITQQIVDKLNGGTLAGSETLRPGYMSTGSNNTLGQIIYGAKPQIPGTPNEVFIDPQVDYSGVEVKKFIIDGKEYLVNPDCNQISYQGPAPSAPSYSETFNIPTNSVPNHPVTPVTPYTPETPTVPTTPVTPETPTTPVTPVTPETPLAPKGTAHPHDQFDTPQGPGENRPPADVASEQQTGNGGRQTGTGQQEAPVKETFRGGAVDAQAGAQAPGASRETTPTNGGGMTNNNETRTNDGPGAPSGPGGE